MKCYDEGVLQSYIDSELSPNMMEEVTQHLERCKTCQYNFNQLIELNDWEIEFKNEVYEQNPVDVDAAWNKFNIHLKNEVRQQNLVVKNKGIIDKIKGALDNMSKIKRFATVTAVSILLVIGVPATAIFAYNLFTSHVLEDSVVNEGLISEDGTAIDAMKDGEFQDMDVKITDDNVTVHLTDLYVSESRISIHYRIEDENGNLIPIEYDTEGMDIKSDGIENGVQVAPPEVYDDKGTGTFSQIQYLFSEDGLPFELMKNSEVLDIGIRKVGDENNGTITFVGFNPIDYPVTLDININKIGKLQGSWKEQIEIMK